MITLPAQEIKRRGIGAVDGSLKQGPVHVIRNNQPRYVVMSADDYAVMIEDLTIARVRTSEEDLAAGRVCCGSAADLMAEINAPEPDA